MLDPTEEKKFDDLRKMCRELHVMPPPEIMIGLQVHKDGILIFDDIQRGHSWLRNYWNTVAWNTFQVYQGTTYAAGSLATQLRIEDGRIGNFAYCGMFTGMKVGTSDTAFDINYPYMRANIVTGTSTGQLVYGTFTRTVPTYANKTWTQIIYQPFTNASGSSVTVKETGLETTGGCTLERSVLSPAVTVSNGAVLTLSYSISMDFSAID